MPEALHACFERDRRLTCLGVLAMKHAICHMPSAISHRGRFGESEFRGAIAVKSSANGFLDLISYRFGAGTAKHRSGNPKFKPQRSAIVGCKIDL